MDRCIEKESPPKADPPPAEKKNQQPSLYPPKSERLNRTTHRDEDRLGLFLARNTEKLGLRVYRFVSKHWLGIINFHLFLFILGSISAPYLSYLGEEGISKYIYGFYGISCHQKASRSFFLFDHPPASGGGSFGQVAICVRCFSFYASMLIFGLLLSLKKVRPLNEKTAFFLALPILADVLLQALGIRESTNLLRVTTALLLSLSISFYVYPRIHLNLHPYGCSSAQTDTRMGGQNRREGPG